MAERPEIGDTHRPMLPVRAGSTLAAMDARGLLRALGRATWRVALLGRVCKISSTPGEGTTIRITVPRDRVV